MSATSGPPSLPGRAAQLVTALGLLPHPEGGYYREVYRSGDVVSRGGRQRSALTSIYFLLAAGEHGRWHVVELDEVWHFYEGDPLELLTYDPATGTAAAVVLGPVGGEQRPAAVVGRGVWQAARSLGSHSLVGCTVAPGFAFEDFRFVTEVPGHQAVFAGPLAAYRALL